MAQDISFGIGADGSEFQTALEQITSQARSAAEQISSSFAGVGETFEKIGGAFAALTAAMAGGAAFKEAIDTTRSLTENALDLGRAMGVSASDSAQYLAEIGQVGGGVDDFSGAIQGLTRQVKTHEQALNDMGIATRNSAGELLPMKDIFYAAVDAVNSYTAGTDRNLAAQTAFGRGMQANSPILKMTKEDQDRAAASAQALGLVVGQQSIADFEAYRIATSEASLVVKGLENAIGSELLPVLTEMATWFREIGPSAASVLRTAMADIVTVFWGLDVAVTAVWDTISAFVDSVIQPLTLLSKALDEAFHGHYAEAKATLAEIPQVFEQRWSTAYDDVVAKAQLAVAKIKAAFTDPVGDAPQPKQGKQFNLPQKPLDDPWADLYAKVSAETDRMLTENQKKITENAAEQLDTQRQLALGEVELREQSLKAQLEAGQISGSQFLTQENELINERLAAQKQYFTTKAALEANDLVEAGKIDAQIAKADNEATKQRAAALKAAHDATLKDWKALANSIQSSLSSSISGMLEGTKTFADAVRSLFNSLIDGLVNMFVKMATQWAENMIIQQTQTSTTNVAGVTSNAAVAATGAMASVAAIPGYGWAAAPAVGADIFAEAMSYLAPASAAGGFDIPYGSNPLTQLHSGEMVLPESLAGPIRQMAAGGGGAGGGDTHVHIHTIDADSFGSFLRRGGAKQIVEGIARHTNTPRPRL